MFELSAKNPGEVRDENIFKAEKIKQVKKLDHAKRSNYNTDTTSKSYTHILLLQS